MNCRQYVYIVFILQCQKVQNNRSTLLTRAETGIVLIVFYHLHTYTVTVSYPSLHMNQVPEKIY